MEDSRKLNEITIKDAKYLSLIVYILGILYTIGFALILIVIQALNATN